MALITKGGTTQLTTNFKESEMQSGSWGKGFLDAAESFDLSDNTINALQIIRNHYNVAIFINSTGRSPQHNMAIGGASKSKHLFSETSPNVLAIDWRFQDQNTAGSAGNIASIDYYSQVKNKTGVLYNQLVSAGIKGFGLYDNFNHIDSRSQTSVSVWDNSTKKKSYTESLSSSFQNNEDGFLDWKKSIINTSIIVLLIIAVLIWWFKFKK